MKKHFLLLVLMALLPMAGWAQIDISDATAGVTPINYGDEAALVIELRKDGSISSSNYDVDTKFYANSLLSEVVMDGENPMAQKKLPTGAYYIKVTGKGAYTGTKAIQLTVNKRPIEVTLNTPLTKVYGATDPALTADNINWTGADFKNGDTKAVFSGTLSYTYDNGSIGTHNISVTGYTADNYTLSITAAITITAKPITTAMITAVENSKTYKGAAYTAADVTVDVKDGSTPLTAGTDFTVGLYSDEALTSAATPTNFGTYYLAIENKADAGYSVTGKLAAGTLNITKAGLTIRALAQEKVYDGTAALPSSAIGKAFEVLGVVGADDIDNDGSTTTFNNVVLSGNDSKNVKTGGYTITPSIAIGNQSDNYDYNFVPATFTINPRELTITANKAKKVYGKAETTVTKMDGSAADGLVGYGGVTYTPTLEKDADGHDIAWSFPDKAEMEAANVADNPATTDVDETKVNGVLRVVREGAGTDENKKVWKDALTMTYNEAADVWKNYTLILKPGDFEITGGKIYITALNQKKNYGEADPSWTAQKDVNFIVSGLSGDEELVTPPTLTRAAGETVKDYVITPSGAVAPDGYEAIVYATGTFTINKRPLTIAPNVQTLNVGNSASDLDQSAYTIKNTKSDEGLKSGDDASQVFTLGIKVGITQPLTAAATYEDGIVITAGPKAANYQITDLSGKLIVVDPQAAIVLNRPAKAAYTADPTQDNAAAVIAAAATAKYTKAQANAYAKANLIGGVAAGDPSETTYTADEAKAYNATLPGHVTTEDFVPYTAATAATYNAGLTGALSATDDLTGEDLAAYNAAMDPDKNSGDPLSAEEAAAYNATLEGAKAVGELTDTHYDEAGAADYNATLPGAISTTDFAPYTDETAYAKNLTLTGHKTIDDLRPACVTFGDFAMVAEKWYPIVLPFATTVKEVSETFGYAIVNILNAANTDKTKIAFKLHMGELPANKPFVVKVYEDINMNEVTFGDPANPYKTGKTIVNGTGDDLVAVDASDVKFIGSYSAKTDGFKSNEAFFSVSASKNEYYWGNTGVNKTYMAPLSAYFQIPEGSAARIIEFEEADGTVTAIQAVNVKTEARSAEGWYTIGGMKLQGAPTQKGVYIQNGKKVIVK